MSESAGEQETVLKVDQDIVGIIVEDIFKPYNDADEAEKLENIHLDDKNFSGIVGKRREADERTRERALNIFQIKEAEKENEVTIYMPTIFKRRVNLFSIFISYVSHGASFRQVFILISMTYEVLQDPVFQGCPQHLLSKWIRT